MSILNKTQQTMLILILEWNINIYKHIFQWNHNPLTVVKPANSTDLRDAGLKVYVTCDTLPTSYDDTEYMSANYFGKVHNYTIIVAKICHTGLLVYIFCIFKTQKLPYIINETIFSK